MFQTFSGNSRRPRQVNLSGQNANPFAASATSWGPATATQQTVAGAQQERQYRQQEREKLNASKQIQRVWRGYKVRADLANRQREVWDRTEVAAADLEDEELLVEQTSLLLRFYNSSQKRDRLRLFSLSRRICGLSIGKFVVLPQIQHKLGKLAIISLQALQAYVISKHQR